MPGPILDQFTNQRISRQRKYQLRREAQGRCRICGAQTGQGVPYCPAHRERQTTLTQLARERRRARQALRQQAKTDPRSLI